VGPGRGRGRPRPAAAPLGAAAVYVALALGDVVPGGWRIVTTFVPQSELSERKRAVHRAERLEAFGREDEEPGAVLFIGSSTIEYFDLEAAFPDARTLNRGIGDEDLAGLRARLLTTVHATRCAAAVVYAASVDFRRHGAPAEEIAASVEVALDEVLATAPDLRLTLIGILPEVEMPDAMDRRLAATNGALARYAEARDRVTFVPTDRPPIVDPVTRRLDPAHARDDLHLSPAGYRVLTGWLLAGDPALAERLR
ncbi:MAG: GDSL-type esterase/lipase family protein, partial [Planctomycetota bacterium]